jgi:hypothetical protein
VAILCLSFSFDSASCGRKPCTRLNTAAPVSGQKALPWEGSGEGHRARSGERMIEIRTARGSAATVAVPPVVGVGRSARGVRV